MSHTLTAPVLHLTYTGMHAGSYLCGRYVSVMGQGSAGTKRAEDRSAHFAYVPQSVLDAGAAPDMPVCAECLHLATCRADECAECAACTVGI